MKWPFYFVFLVFEKNYLHHSIQLYLLIRLIYRFQRFCHRIRKYMKFCSNNFTKTSIFCAHAHMTKRACKKACARIFRPIFVPLFYFERNFLWDQYFYLLFFLNVWGEQASSIELSHASCILFKITEI